MTHYSEQAESLARHLAIAPFGEALAAAGAVSLDEDDVAAILDQAARFAASALDGIGDALDAEGARLADGRVRTCARHQAAWRAFCEAGWLTLALPEPHGQHLPLPVVAACEELFNRASAAFYMLSTSTRCGAELLLQCAPEAIAAQWVPRLAAGEWTATICISEPDAGSDVGRIRTRAVQRDGVWRVTGEKCWISFGDHDLGTRIGHLMLARTSDDVGVRGLGLFLVPDSWDDASNGVVCRRIEEKLGLHGSPTCVLGFEDAQGVLIGAPGEGLRQMFQMMLQMRLGCGAQGIGVAAAAFDTALGYAAERRQGGAPDAPPVALTHHADIQRQLLEMAASVELGRALNIACAQVMELSRCASGDDDTDWSALAQMLLPIVKDGAAWAAVNVSSQAIQVLGGAGYTREWPVERLLRDARVFPIFEGTTGIQAQDMVHRRVWRDRRAGLDLLLRFGREEAALSGDGGALSRALDLLDAAASHLEGLRSDPVQADAGAVAFLDLCRLCAHGWLAQRIVRLAGDAGPAAQRMTAAAHFFLAQLAPRAELASSLAQRGAAPLAHFAKLMANRS